jgi:hypothetical protein
VERLKALGFATPNIGLLTDSSAVRGAPCRCQRQVDSDRGSGQRRFDDLDYLYDIMV